MTRVPVRLLAQPPVAGRIAAGCTVGVHATVGLGSILSAVGYALGWLAGPALCRHALALRPRPDNPVTLIHHGEWDDVIVRKDAKTVIPTVVVAVTAVPFLILPLDVYRGLGVPLSMGLLVGGWATEYWVVLRWTAQYLPRGSPHLSSDDYTTPVEDGR